MENNYGTRSEPPRLAFREGDELASESATLPVRVDRNVVEQQVVGFWQQDDQRGDCAIPIFEHIDRTGGNQPGVVVEHRPRRLADALNIDRVSGVDDRLDRCAVSGPSYPRHCAYLDQWRQNIERN